MDKDGQYHLVKLSEADIVLIRKWMAAKLAALRRMQRHLHELTPVTREEISARLARYGERQILGIAERMLDEDLVPEQRMACAYLLDEMYPPWREIPELVGVMARRTDSRAWRKQVLERDGYRCVKCGGTKRLHAHHLQSWAEAPMLRLDVRNGVTLCEPCHITWHSEHRL
jgi:hypothetical protein